MEAAARTLRKEGACLEGKVLTPCVLNDLGALRMLDAGAKAAANPAFATKRSTGRVRIIGSEASMEGL